MTKRLFILAFLCCIPLHADSQPDIPSLLRDLDSSQYTVRQQAAVKLDLILDPAHPAVARALAEGSLEQRRALQQIITRPPNHRRLAVTDAMLENLARFGGLSSLDLSGCVNLTSKGLAVLGRLPKLRRLSLARCPIKRSDLELLPRGLRHLDLSGCAVSLDQLKTLPQLESLAAPPGTDAAQLKRLVRASPALKRLDLSDCSGVGDAGVRALGTLKQLARLDLSGCGGVGDAGVRVLGALRRLTWLDLSGCAGITDDGVSALKGLTLLRDLRLADCERLTNRSLATLAVLGELRELDLSNCVRITQVGRLRSLSRLSSIDLSGFPTPDAGLKSKQRRIRPPWKTRPLESKPDQVFECCNNLKILGMQLMIYRQKHQDRYPPLRSLLSVQPQASLRRCCFVSSRHGRVSRGYGWTSHPIRSMKDASQRPVAWCRGGIHKGGWRPVVFLDGHVERVTEKQFREDIARLDKRVARMEQAGRGSLHDH